MPDEVIIVEEVAAEVIVVKEYIEPDIVVSTIAPTDTTKLWVDITP